MMLRFVIEIDSLARTISVKEQAQITSSIPVSKLSYGKEPFHTTIHRAAKVIEDLLLKAGDTTEKDPEILYGVEITKPGGIGYVTKVGTDKNLAIQKIKDWKDLPCLNRTEFVFRLVKSLDGGREWENA